MSKNANGHISLSSLPGKTAPEAAPGASREASREALKGPKGLTLKPGQVVCGELDMRIDRNGVWYYHGSPIGRKKLVRLFSTVLRRDEAGDYWLITPAEAGRIAVDDAPFMAVELTRSGDGPDQVISLRNNVDDNVTVDADHPIRVDFDPETAEPSPYVVLEGGIEARIARSVYYELVALGTEEKSTKEKTGGENTFGVWSSGVFFALGKLGGKLEGKGEEKP